MQAPNTEEQRKPAADGRKGRVGFSITLLLCCSFLLLCSFVRGADRDWKTSLVKVYLNRNFSGLLQEKRFIPQIQVRQVTEFKGAVVGVSGHVVSYVGSYGPDFSFPGARVTVESSDKQRYAARVIGLDERINLVVLESQAPPQRSLNFGSSLPGEKPLFVVWDQTGNWEIRSPPFFHSEGSDWLPEDEVQVSGPTGRENLRAWEGSLMVNKQGGLLGIVTRASRHPLGRKIAVFRVLPLRVVRRSVDRILKEEKNIRAGWLGMVLDVDPQRSPLSKNTPLYTVIRQVVAGSPAERAGLKPGDQLLEIEGRPIESLGRVVRGIQWKGAGERLTLSISRQGRVRKISALLTQRQDRQPMVSWALDVPRFWEDESVSLRHLRLYRTVFPAPLALGFVLEPLTPQLADYFRTPNGRGLLVKSVRQESLAQAAGFLAGDVLPLDTAVSPSRSSGCIGGGEGSAAVPAAAGWKAALLFGGALTTGS